MRILELTTFSAGICGVWNRVKKESELLSKKGHQVMVFSSNIIKNTGEIAPEVDRFGKVEIKRFSAIKLGGESFMIWNFSKAWKEAVKFYPDTIICHSYRHSHTSFALILAKRLGAKVILVTHAPFVEGHITRSLPAAILTEVYDHTIGQLTINKFDKVVAITLWENTYLNNLGLNKNQLIYVPNGIPE